VTADATDPSVCDGAVKTHDVFEPATGWAGSATDAFDWLGARTANYSDEDAAPDWDGTKTVDQTIALGDVTVW
jgi:hypothetical protein